MVTVTKYRDLPGNTQTANTIPTPVVGPSIGVTVTGQNTGSTPMPPPPTATSNSITPTGRDAIIAQLYPEYIDPATGKPYAGPTTTLRGGSGGTGPGGTVGVTRQRTTPETHPWLYPQGGVDPLAGKNYAQADWSPGGVAQGFPDIPQLSAEERQAAADTQNYSRNDGQGLDPTLMRGMQRTSRSSPYSNQYGNYTPADREYVYNPATRRWGTNISGSSFTGQDQSGNVVNYTGDIPYGQQLIQAMQEQAARMRGPGGLHPYGGGPGAVPGGGTGVGGRPFGSGGGPRTGGVNNDPGVPGTNVGNRSWQNTRGTTPSRGVPGINVGSGGLPNTPAMTALQRALMGRWGG